MAAPRTLVELFYDVVSPYSWLGFEVLCRYQHIWNINLRFRPAFLGGIMQATGNKPPAMLPKRAEYLLKDIKRMGKYYQVPVQISADDFQRILSKGSLGAMRFITAIDMTQPQFVETISREFWIRFWSQREDINQPASILAVAKQAGLSSEEAQKLLEMVSSPAVKNRLKETTEDAIKYGEKNGWDQFLHFQAPRCEKGKNIRRKKNMCVYVNIYKKCLYTYIKNACVCVYKVFLTEHPRDVNLC
ncbi:glutathione S-transferase kappa 1 isoform X1 [Rhea pennata]|uniref:glutathione S-transferase kappa 1 isoform X1 n=1 Tax=Rhea pennata TaxID=8795 RepID=UPI002E26F3B0